MQVNPVKSKAVSFTIARVKGRIRYYLVDQLIPESSSFKYLGIIMGSDLTFILRHLIWFSCRRYGVYIGQHFKLLRVVAYRRV